MARPKKIQGEDENSHSDKDGKNVLKLGGNIGPLKDEIVKAGARITEILTEVKALHEEKNALRAQLEVMGMDKEGFDKGLKDSKREKEKRAAYDESLALTREALGCPIGSLFDYAADQPQQQAAH